MLLPTDAMVCIVVSVNAAGEAEGMAQARLNPICGTSCLLVRR